MARIANDTTYDSEPVAADEPDFWLEHLGAKRLAYEMWLAGRTRQEIILRTHIDTIDLDMRMNAANG